METATTWASPNACAARKESRYMCMAPTPNAREEATKPKNVMGPVRLGPLLQFAAFGLRKGARPRWLTSVREVSDGDVLPLPGEPRAVGMPGHSPGSIAVYFPAARAVFVGDALTTRHVLTGRVRPGTRPLQRRPCRGARLTRQHRRSRRRLGAAGTRAGVPRIACCCGGGARRKPGLMGHVGTRRTETAKGGGLSIRPSHITRPVSEVPVLVFGGLSLADDVRRARPREEVVIRGLLVTSSRTHGRRGEGAGMRGAAAGAC